MARMYQSQSFTGHANIQYLRTDEVCALFVRCKDLLAQFFLARMVRQVQNTR